MYSHYGDTFMAFILHRIYTLDSAPQQWQSAAYSASAQNFSPGWEKILRQSPLSFQPVRHTTQSVYLRMPIICTQPVSAAEITDEACASIITSHIQFIHKLNVSAFPCKCNPFIHNIWKYRTHLPDQSGRTLLFPYTAASFCLEQGKPGNCISVFLHFLLPFWSPVLLPQAVYGAILQLFFQRLLYRLFRKAFW